MLFQSRGLCLRKTSGGKRMSPLHRLLDSQRLQPQTSDQDEWKLDSVIRTTNYRLSRKYNQRDKCKERKYRSAPQGCYISHLPSRANLPTFGKTADWRLQPFLVMQNVDNNILLSYCPASELCEADLVLFPRNNLHFSGSFTDGDLRCWKISSLRWTDSFRTNCPEFNRAFAPKPPRHRSNENLLTISDTFFPC